MAVGAAKGDGTRITNTLDKTSKTTKVQYTFNKVKFGTSYYYAINKDNALSEITLDNGAKFRYGYDTFGRFARAIAQQGSYEWYEDYTYLNPNTTRTSNKISTISFPQYYNGARTLTYAYDNVGNITKVTDKKGTASSSVSYTYDALGQMTYEYNGTAGPNSTYTYDKRGNITKKTVVQNGVAKTCNYTYGDANWPDKLTSYDGKAITYQGGNPTSYDGWTFSWQGGNRLTSMTKTGKSAMSFKYNDSGIRTEKKVGTVTTKYMLDGSNIVAMQTGTATPMYFSYDANGKRLGVKYTNGLYYYYVYNQQGDVIAMHNGSGSVVAQYKYDAWGNILSITNGNGVDISNDATSLGYNNPFRYRGYYYDTETGLYYLNARYYNPEWGRFINADTTDVLTASMNKSNWEKNLFAYCDNNPVMRTDADGEAWYHWALAAAVVAVAAVAVVATAGGAAPAIMAATSVANGFAAATTASTVAAGAFLGSSAALGIMALDAAANSKSVKDFNKQGNWGTVGATAVGGITGGVTTYVGTKATFKSNPGKPFKPGVTGIQRGVDPNTLTPSKNLKNLDPKRMSDAVKFGGNRAIRVGRTGIIQDGHHRVSHAIIHGRAVDIFVEPYK